MSFALVVTMVFIEALYSEECITKKEYVISLLTILGLAILLILGIALTI